MQEPADGKAPYGGQVWGSAGPSHLQHHSEPDITWLPRDCLRDGSAKNMQSQNLMDQKLDRTETIVITWWRITSYLLCQPISYPEMGKVELEQKRRKRQAQKEGGGADRKEHDWL